MKYAIRIERFAALRPEHKDKECRASIYRNDLAVLESFSALLQMDLTGAEQFLPRRTEWSQKAFKSKNPKIRNFLVGYEYWETTTDISHFSLTFEIRVKGDERFVVDHFETLVELARGLGATRVQVEPDDSFPHKPGLGGGGASILIDRCVPPEAKCSAYDVSTLWSMTSYSYPYPCDYSAMAQVLAPVVEKVALLENGVVSCAPKAWMDQEEYYQWNRAVLRALGLYGYGNMPTTRRTGKFYWHRDACPDFFAELPDDLAERLYAETPLAFLNYREPIGYNKDGKSLSLQLPGIEDEAGEKAFWDLHLAKHLGPYEAAVHTMMHQYDRFL